MSSDRSAAATPCRNYIGRFKRAQARPETTHKIRTIAPIPDTWPGILQKLTAAVDTCERAEVLKKYRESFRDAPEPDCKDYDSVPVEGYGLAILLGYGRTGNSTADVKVPKIVVRNERWGLGYTGDPIESSGKVRRVLEAREKRLVLVDWMRTR